MIEERWTQILYKEPMYDVKLYEIMNTVKEIGVIKEVKDIVQIEVDVDRKIIGNVISQEELEVGLNNVRKLQNGTLKHHAKYAVSIIPIIHYYEIWTGFQNMLIRTKVKQLWEIDISIIETHKVEISETVDVIKTMARKLGYKYSEELIIATITSNLKFFINSYNNVIQDLTNGTILHVLAGKKSQLKESYDYQSRILTEMMSPMNDLHSRILDGTFSDFARTVEDVISPNFDIVGGTRLVKREDINTFILFQRETMRVNSMLECTMISNKNHVKYYNCNSSAYQEQINSFTEYVTTGSLIEVSRFIDKLIVNIDVIVNTLEDLIDRKSIRGMVIKNYNDFKYLTLIKQIEDIKCEVKESEVIDKLNTIILLYNSIFKSGNIIESINILRKNIKEDVFEKDITFLEEIIDIVELKKSNKVCTDYRINEEEYFMLR